MSEEIGTSNHTEEIDLLELAKKIWDKRRFILKYAAVGAAVGLIVAFSIPGEFTSSAKMAPEGLKSTQGGGMADLAALAGFDLGGKGGVDGINLTLYPDVVNSTPFIAELSQIPVQLKKGKKQLSLYQYISTEISGPWWGYIIQAPMQAIGWVLSIGKEKEPEGNGTINPKNLTLKQEKVLEMLSQRISISIDKKTGVITAAATMQDPVVAAAVTDSMVRKLEEYMADYRTEKAKRDLVFTQESYLSAQKQYHATQRQYASYMDATQNVARQSVRAEQDRLRNEQTLAYSVYSQLAQQLELAKIKVQEQTPCVTIIDPAGVPIKKSNTSKAIILAAFIFLGGFIATGTVVVKDLFFNKKEEDQTESASERA